MLHFLNTLIKVWDPARPVPAILWLSSRTVGQSRSHKGMQQQMPHLSQTFRLSRAVPTHGWHTNYPKLQVVKHLQPPTSTKIQSTRLTVNSAVDTAGCAIQDKTIHTSVLHPGIPSQAKRTPNPAPLQRPEVELSTATGICCMRMCWPVCSQSPPSHLKS